MRGQLGTFTGATLLWVVLLSAPACSDATEDDGSGGSAGSGGAAGGTGGVGGNTFCPDPDHARVHYVSADPSECAGIDLICDAEQYGFDNACGCGCIDKGDPLCPTPVDPAIKWISMDPATCPSVSPSCALGETPFNNSCGCGCIQV